MHIERLPYRKPGLVDAGFVKRKKGEHFAVRWGIAIRRKCSPPGFWWQLLFGREGDRWHCECGQAFELKRTGPFCYWEEFSESNEESPG